MKINIFILVALFISTTTTAQTLDRDLCRKMALENNKKLSIATVAKEQFEFDAKASRANYFPKISATSSYLASTGTTGFALAGGYLPTFIPSADGMLLPNYALSPSGSPIVGVDGNPVFNQYAYMPDMEIDIDLNNSYMVGVRLEQPIYMGGKIRAANSAAKLAVEIANENIRKTSAEVIVESDQAYWQYVKVREMVVVALKYQKVVEELIRNIQNAVEVGMSSNNNLLRAQTKLNEAKLMVRKAENGVRLARMNLCHIVGLNLTSSVEIKDLTGENLVKPNFMGDDIDSRAEIEILSKQVEILGEQVRVARSESLPSVGVMGGYAYSGGMKVNNDAITNGSFSALISVSVPIFRWGEGRNKVRSARAKQEIASIKKEEYQQLMRLEANKSFNEFEEAYYRVELTNQSLVAAADNMKNSENSYNLGMDSLAEYLEAQTAWQQAWADYIDAKAMFQLGETYYLKSIGKLY